MAANTTDCPYADFPHMRTWLFAPADLATAGEGEWGERQDEEGGGRAGRADAVLFPRPYSETAAIPPTAPMKTCTNGYTETVAQPDMPKSPEASPESGEQGKPESPTVWARTLKPAGGV